MVAEHLTVDDRAFVAARGTLPGTPSTRAAATRARLSTRAVEAPATTAVVAGAQTHKRVAEARARGARAPRRKGHRTCFRPSVLPQDLLVRRRPDRLTRDRLR